MWPWIAGGVALVLLLQQRGGFGGQRGGTLAGDMIAEEVIDGPNGPIVVRRQGGNVQGAKPGAAPTVLNPNVAGPVVAPTFSHTASADPRMTASSDTVLTRDQFGRPSTVQRTTPGSDLIGVYTIDYAPGGPAASDARPFGNDGVARVVPDPGAGMISVSAAQAQAASAFQSHFGYAASPAQLAALSAAYGAPVTNGMVSQADVTAFLNSAAALAAVTP